MYRMFKNNKHLCTDSTDNIHGRSAWLCEGKGPSYISYGFQIIPKLQKLKN